jgi:hypothetical protein
MTTNLGQEENESIFACDRLPAQTAEKRKFWNDSKTNLVSEIQSVAASAISKAAYSSQPPPPVLQDSRETKQQTPRERPSARWRREGRGRRRRRRRRRTFVALGVGFDAGQGRMRNTVHLILYTDKQHIRIRIGAIYSGKITERSKESPFLFQKIIFLSFYWVFNNKYYSKP